MNFIPFPQIQVLNGLILGQTIKLVWDWEYRNGLKDYLVLNMRLSWGVELIPI